VNYAATRALVDRCLALRVGGLARQPAKPVRTVRCSPAVPPPVRSPLIAQVCTNSGKHIRTVAAWLEASPRGAQITAPELNLPLGTCNGVFRRFIDVGLIRIARPASRGCGASPTLYEKL